jgi:hypothetical protein
VKYLVRNRDLGILRESCLTAVDVHRDSDSLHLEGTMSWRVSLSRHSAAATFRSTGRLRSVGKKKFQFVLLCFHVCETWPLTSKEGGTN